VQGPLGPFWQPEELGQQRQEECKELLVVVVVVLWLRPPVCCWGPWQQQVGAVLAQLQCLQHGLGKVGAVVASDVTASGTVADWLVEGRCEWLAMYCMGLCDLSRV